MPDTLIIFAKAPKPGRVKTRLFPDLTPAQAMELYRAFVEDLLESTGRLEDVSRIVGCDPSKRDPYFRSLAEQHDVELIDQTGVDLGERMANAFLEIRSRGTGPIVIIGTDSPTLPMEMIREAYRFLERHDLVLGPSLDGGYYLIGCSGEVPPVFEGIPWGTDEVLPRTLTEAARMKVNLGLLPFWYDVDTMGDLLFLSAHLQYLEHQAGRPVCARTKRVIEGLTM